MRREQRHPGAHALRDPVQDGERRAADRQRRVGAHQHEGVRVRELPPRHHVRQGCVSRRPPQQRQALDHERQQVDRPQVPDERHRQVQRRPAEVGRDHELLTVRIVQPS